MPPEITPLPSSDNEPSNQEGYSSRVIRIARNAHRISAILMSTGAGCVVYAGLGAQPESDGRVFSGVVALIMGRIAYQDIRDLRFIHRLSVRDEHSQEYPDQDPPDY
jgi:hypothetical protein